MVLSTDSKTGRVRVLRIPALIVTILLVVQPAVSQTTTQLKIIDKKDVTVQIDDGKTKTANRPGTWSEWENLGEQVASAPSAVSGGDHHLAVFFRGGDAHLRSVWWGGGLWHLGRDIGPIIVPDLKPSQAEKIAQALRWRLKDALDFEGNDGSVKTDPLTAPEAPAVGDTLYYKNGNRIPVNSAPACVMKSPRHIDCFVLDYAGRLWHRWYRGDEGWDRWQALSRGRPQLTTSPTATSWNDRRIDVFARGSDGQLMRRPWDGKKWQNWQELGLIDIETDVLSMGVELGSAPSCIAPAENRFECFVRGPGNHLFKRSFSGRRWGQWRDLGGSMTSAPSATFWEDGRIDVFARGEKNQLIHTFWDGRQWWPWDDLGGDLESAPSCVARRGVIDCFAQGNHPSTGATDVLLHKWMVLPR